MLNNLLYASDLKWAALYVLLVSKKSKIVNLLKSNGKYYSVLVLEKSSFTLKIWFFVPKILLIFIFWSRVKLEIHNLAKLRCRCRWRWRCRWGKSNLKTCYRTCPNWIKLVHIGSNLSELDQTCPNRIKLVGIGSNLSKLD